MSITKLTVDGKEDELLQEMHDAVNTKAEARYKAADLMRLERESNREGQRGKSFDDQPD